MTMIHEDTLQVAEFLLAVDQPDGFAHRRAASSAYYALFQRLSLLCAVCLSRTTVAYAEYRRAYRALEHRQVRDTLSRSDDFRVPLGTPFAELQDIRQWADYSVSSHPDEAEANVGRLFTPNEARDSVDTARDAIRFVDGLELPLQQRLAVLLVVRDRR
jgi:hypothetical protein